jgi:hypothetical protein
MNYAPSFPLSSAKLLASLRIVEPISTVRRAGIRGMLCSPNFLFRQEGESGPLDEHAIAARMSYFLWNSLPD